MSDYQRAGIQAAANALNFAIIATVHWAAPDFPDAVLMAWMAVFATLARLAENWYDVKDASP